MRRSIALPAVAATALTAALMAAPGATMAEPASAAVSDGSTSAAEVSDLPTFVCSADSPGYVFKTKGSAHAAAVDVASGEVEVVAEEFWEHRINGLGYNPLDDYIYGSFGTDDGWGFGRMGSDFSVEFLEVPGRPQVTGATSGEFTSDGHYWAMFGGSTASWVELDMNPASDAYMSVVSHGDFESPDGWRPAVDWAVNVDDGNLYTVGSNIENPNRWGLLKFDTTEHSMTVAAELGELDSGDGPLIGGRSNSVFGATFADADGFIYASHNGSGEIWRVDTGTGEAEFHAQGPADFPNNDGARCAQPPVTDQPAFVCGAGSPGYLFQRGGPMDVTMVDLETGESEVAAEGFWPRRSNALGYNMVDDYIYGSFDTSDGWQFGRVGSDFSVELLGKPDGWADGPGGDWGNTTRRVVADFTPNGHYWAMLRNGSTSSWVEVDMTGASRGRMSVVSHGDFEVPDGWVTGSDWAFNVDDGNLYMVGHRGDDPATWGLLAFDTAEHSMTVAAEFGELDSGDGPLVGRAFGAMYADVDGFGYAMHNRTGEIWRIDMSAGTAEFAAQTAAVTDSDGARCSVPKLDP